MSNAWSKSLSKSFSKSLARALAALVLVAASAGAQAAPRDLRLALGGSVGTMPDAFAAQCGEPGSGAPALGAGVGVLAHLTRWIVARGDAQLTQTVLSTGCDLVGHFRPIDATHYAEVGTPQYPGAPDHTLASTAARLGVETPTGAVLLRATVGAGAVWSSRVLPVGLATFGVGTRGKRTRVHLEWEHAVSRVSGTRALYLYDSRGVPLGQTSERIRTSPQWSTLRMLVEIPLGGR